MSNDIRIKNGLTINLKGAAKNIVKKAPYPKSVSLNPSNFHLIIPKMVVKVGEKVNAGDAIFYSKKDERIKFCSPVDGIIKEIVRGAKRKIIEIVINVDNQKKIEPSIIEFEKLNPDEIKNTILKSGCWPFIKQRPYDIIANPSDKPKSIFISSFNSAPISADFQIILEDQKEEFKMGLQVLSKLTDGEINICIQKDVSTFINDINGIKVHSVSGPHPSGNVGVQIHHINPINSGEKIWTIGPEDVAILGRFFLTGIYKPIRTIAVSGAPVKNPQYYKTIAGSELYEIINDAGTDSNDSLRIINGDVLTGNKVEPDNYLGFYNNTVSVLREGNQYRMFGWVPFINNVVPSIYKTSFSWLFPNKKYDLDTNLNGEERAFVVTGEMERVFPMDIYPMQLLKECMAENIDKMESLGIYEVAPEDFSLIDYSSSSKIEAQYIIRKGLDLMIKEVG
tara:strand:+ start:14555 stop:15907 length:1353 start_codon:yes stop_codon:yes gene_type:complete